MKIRTRAGAPVRRRFRTRRARVRIVLAVFGGAFACVALWGAGLVWFSRQIPRSVEDPLAVTDAIVVLTGGAGRLGAGLELLAQGKAGNLFISGVYRGVDVDAILLVSRQAPNRLECCIEVGYDATDTAGNARETARWMAAEGLSSLFLVTANYHMPRSLAEFSRVMPHVKLVPYPVFADNVRMEEWWSSPRSLGLIASEFTKYLIGMARPTPSPSE